MNWWGWLCAWVRSFWPTQTEIALPDVPAGWCRRCYGKGTVPSRVAAVWIPCPVCKGTGTF